MQDMIKRLYRSKFDIENLSSLRTLIPNEVDIFDYRKVVVNKPWGYEYLLFQNSYVAIWVLYLKYNHSTSMHCHPTKKTSLTVLSGKVQCSTLDGWNERKKGEGLMIDDAVFHSTKAISKEGAFIMEVESPPNKKDLVRLRDGYGRENQGYESQEYMSKEFKKYEYVNFHSDDFKKKPVKTIKNCKLTISLEPNPKDIHKLLKKEEGQLICILQGKLHDREGKVLLAIGELAVLSDIVLKRQVLAFGDIMYMTMNFT